MLDVEIEGDHLVRYAAEHGLPLAPTVEGDEFIRPLLQMMASQIAQFPGRGGQEHGIGSIRIGLIDKPSPNAFVDLWDGCAVICVHSGMLQSIVEAAIQMQDRIGAFDPEFEQGQGAPDRSGLDDPLGMTGYLNWLRGHEDETDLFGDAETRDDVATWRASSFIAAGLQFVVLHEFSHIANGHLGYLQAARQPCRLFEMQEGARPSSVLNPEIRQFLEHEADIFALEILIRSALNRHLAGTKLTMASGDEVVVFMLSFLTTVFGWITLEQAFGRSENAAHPQAFDRLFTLPMALTGLLEQQPEFEAPLSKVLNRCRIVLGRSIGRYPQFAPLAEIFSPAQLARLDEKIAWMNMMDGRTTERTRWRL